MIIGILNILHRNINFHHLFLAHNTFQFAPKFDWIIMSKLNFMLDLDHINFSLIPNSL
jgi:hypothetical protein